MGAKNIMGSGEVKRAITGDWVDQFYGTHRNRRGDIDGEKGFRPMAAMKLYLTGMGSNRQDPQDLASFEAELDALEAKYTSYGCYCWINGMSDGVIGGGKTKDVTDHHCKELYRCYKCVNNDYAKNYTDVSYTVEFTMKGGERTLDCSVNSKQDAENICECDKRFAENMQLLKHLAMLVKQLTQSGVITVCQNHSEQEMLEVHSTHKINVINNSMDTIKLNVAVSTQT